METLTTDEDVKVNINAKKEDNEAVLAPLDERGPEKLETTVEDDLNTPPIQEGSVQDPDNKNNKL